LLLVTLFLVETGCNQHFLAGSESVPSNDSAPDSDGASTDHLKELMAEKKRVLNAMENNPCGLLKLSGNTRLFNITGRITSRVLPGTEIRMFITPNTSLNHSLHVVRNCLPFWRARVNDGGKFNIADVPPGKYILYLPIDSFPQGTQGFPIPGEFQMEDHRLVLVFQGGDPESSLGVFRIERLDSNCSS